MSDGITDAERMKRTTLHNVFTMKATNPLQAFSTAELVNELCKREGVKEYKIFRNEEGVINKYIPSGFEGKEKTPENLAWGIYHPARILAVTD